MVFNVFEFELFSAVALATDLSTPFPHMSEVVLVLYLDLTLGSRGAAEQHSVESHPRIAVQGLHVQIRTPSRTHEHRGGVGGASDEVLYARLTKDHVALGALEGVHWGDEVVTQTAHEVGLHEIGF